MIYIRQIGPIFLLIAPNENINSSQQLERTQFFFQTVKLYLFIFSKSCSVHRNWYKSDTSKENTSILHLFSWEVTIQRLEKLTANLLVSQTPSCRKFNSNVRLHLHASCITWDTSHAIFHDLSTSGVSSLQFIFLQQ